jgi:hypothetical protein
MPSRATRRPGSRRPPPGSLGETERRSGLPQNAQPHFERALELLRANADAQSPAIARAEFPLAACLVELGKPRSARALSDHARSILEHHGELESEAVRAWRSFS